MDFMQLNYFLAFARNQSLLAASEELNISPSTISLSVSRLEEELGVSLFEKVGRNKRLTPKGAAFRDRLEKIFCELDEAVDEVKDESDTATATITLFCDDGALLTRSSIGFLQTHPEIKMQQTFTTAKAAFKKLAGGGADFAMTLVPSDNPQLRSVLLIEYEINLIVNKEHWAANKQKVTLRDLADEKFVTTPIGHSFRTTMDNAFSSMGFVPKVYTEVGDVYAVRKLVASNIGVSLATDWLWYAIENEDMEELDVLNKIEVIPLAERIGRKCVYLTYNVNRRFLPSVWGFYQYLVNFFEEESARIDRFISQRNSFAQTRKQP